MKKSSVNKAAANLMFKFRQNGLKEQDGERITISDEVTVKNERNDEVTVKNFFFFGLTATLSPDSKR